MTAGIYCIENKVNNKKYIGLAVDIERRWSLHKTSLRGDYHDNNYLQRAWNKYKEKNFNFWIIEETNPDGEELKLLEIYFISYYNSFKDDGGGYNLTRGGDGCFGWKPSPENIKNNSKAQTGKIMPKETKLKISNALIGRHISEEHRIKKQGKKENRKTLPTSKYVGVYFNKKRNIWRYILHCKGETIEGIAKTEISAALFYNIEAIKYYGNDAKINFVSKKDIKENDKVLKEIEEERLKNKTSKYIGVYYDKTKSKWIYSLCKDRKIIKGAKEIEEEAAIEYDEIYKRLYNTSTGPNFPDIEIRKGGK